MRIWMGRNDCKFDGDMEDSMFSKPMLWIGIYVAAASLACLFAMAIDVLRGLLHKKLWFPCKYFSLNSTSLTILSVAVKFPMDLTTQMPRREDQLAKLSSTILICTAMANFMPSLGTMEKKEISMNVMALSILVITLVVDVSIQIGTGAIYIFIPEHVLIMFSMLALLVILAFSALSVPTTKRSLEKQYHLKLQQAKDEALHTNNGESSVKELTEDVKKSWMMAYTCSPQFVMGRWVTCAFSGVLCAINALILLEAIFRSSAASLIGSLVFCEGESDYNWSTIVVLAVQSVGVAVGTIAPVYRWFNVINHSRYHKRGKHSRRNEFKVEKHWIGRLEKWKESSFALRIHGRQCRKFVHTTKNLLLDFCIGMQTTIVVVSKAVLFVSILLVSQIGIFSYCCCCSKRSNKGTQSNAVVSKNDLGLELGPIIKLDLSHFVIHLKGEEKLVEFIAKKSCEATDNWIQRGRTRQPTYLIQLLDKSVVSQGFKGVRDFESVQVPTLSGSKEAPHGWALTLVTLLSIAIALPNIDNHLVKNLLHGVREGLKYVRLVEKKLDKKGEFTNISKAADIVWLGIDFYNKWLDEDLQKLALQGKSATEIIEKLADTGKKYVREFKNSPHEWPIKVLAANSMYRVGQTILQDTRYIHNVLWQRH